MTPWLGHGQTELLLQTACKGAWVNAAEQLVADPGAELSVLQKLTLQLHAAVKPRNQQRCLCT